MLSFLSRIFSKITQLRFYSKVEFDELQRRLDRYDRIFKNSNIARGYGYFDWDLSIKKMGWSAGYWRHLGYTDDDIDYISLSDNYYDYIHPDDVERTYNATISMLKNPRPMEVCHRVRSKDGRYIWTEIRCDATCSADGRVLFMSGIAIDVTQQRQMEQALKTSEERNRRILRSSKDGIWEWSIPKGGFHFIKRCWEQIGFMDEKDVGSVDIGKWRSRIHSDDLGRFDATLKEHLRDERSFSLEYRIRAKDNSWCWIRTRAQAELGANGKLVRMSGTNVDITELKRAEERVLKAKEQAEQANQAKSEFLSRMSHELRTPLNAIMGFTQLLEFDANLNEQQRDNVLEVQSAGQHLLQLVGDILDLSRIEAGRMMFSLERIEPVALLKECIAFMQPQAEKRDIQFVLNENDLSSIGITADCVRVRQVFLNLMSNAIKYNKLNGQVKINCSIVDEHYIKIEVRDTGRGIPEEKESDVFEPFYRLGAEQSSIEGTGVGLVITRQLVEQMAGDIGFHNHSDEGCTFWVLFPFGELGGIKDDNDCPYLPDTSDQLAEGINLTLKSPKNILYVEDNASNQRLMSQLFTYLPLLELRLADDAFKGLFSARTEPPDLIIMDIHMPDMGGFEALEVLKADPRTAHIPVIALSANAMAHDLKKGTNSKFFAYLTKPINLQRLVHVLNDCLSESECELEN